MSDPAAAPRPELPTDAAALEPLGPEHNDRDWFRAEQERFEDEVREPVRAFVRAVRPHVLAICPRLVVDPARSGGSMLRMHRDVRFSADRRPYHTRVFVSFPHEDEERERRDLVQSHPRPELDPEVLRGDECDLTQHGSTPPRSFRRRR